MSMNVSTSTDAKSVDLTPVIRYNSGVPVEIETYCLVNLTSVAISNYGINPDGFYESHFDEHHEIFVKEKPTTKARLSSIGGNLPILAILEAGNRKGVEALVSEAKVKVRHEDL